MAPDETKPVFDFAPDEALEARLDAEAEIDAGKGVPREIVPAWLRRLAGMADNSTSWLLHARPKLSTHKSKTVFIAFIGLFLTMSTQAKSALDEFEHIDFCYFDDHGRPRYIQLICLQGSTCSTPIRLAVDGIGQNYTVQFDLSPGYVRTSIIPEKSTPDMNFHILPDTRNPASIHLDRNEMGTGEFQFELAQTSPKPYDDLTYRRISPAIGKFLVDVFISTE